MKIKKETVEISVHTRVEQVDTKIMKKQKYLVSFDFNTLFPLVLIYFFVFHCHFYGFPIYH